MTIYLLRPDHAFQSLLPSDPDFFRKTGPFSPLPKSELWKDFGEDGPEFYDREPAKTKPGHFLNLALGALTYTDSAHRTAAGRLLGASGEVLPARLDRGPEPLKVLNVLTCYDCFDMEASKYRKAGSAVVEIYEHVFLPDLIGDLSVFKSQIRQNTSIYTIAGRGDAENEFYHQYKNAGLTGLVFEEVWSA